MENCVIFNLSPLIFFYLLPPSSSSTERYVYAHHIFLHSDFHASYRKLNISKKIKKFNFLPVFRVLSFSDCDNKVLSALNSHFHFTLWQFLLSVTRWGLEKFLFMKVSFDSFEKFVGQFS